MKFNSAWDTVEKENRSLRFLVIGLLLLAIALSIAVMSNAAQAPLIIERGCFSRVLSPVGDASSDDEMKAFASVAVKARFDTKASDTQLLTILQLGYRATEQDELSKQKMKQTVIVNDISIAKDGLTVDADRLISVGEIRSTLKFPLKVQLVRVARSESNPYGLQLSAVEEIKPEVKK